MNKVEVNAKLQYVFEGLPLSKTQKEMLGDVVMAIMETAIAGVTEPEIAKASNAALGGIKTGYSQNAKNYPVSLDGDGKAFVNVPWTDNNTTYNVATTSANGLMSKEDKAKLDNIANNANNYSLPNATTSKIGGVKQAATVEALEEADEIATVISTVNTLISNLKAAGVVANS